MYNKQLIITLKVVKKLSLLPLLLCSVFVVVGCISNNNAPTSILHADTYSSLTSSEHRTLPVLDDKVFTLNDAISIGLANSPTYEDIKLQLQNAYNQYYKSLFSYLPTTTANMTGGLDSGQTRSPDNRRWERQDWSRSAGAGISTNFILFDGFSREMDLLASYENVKISVNEVQHSMLVLINSIIDIYYQMVIMKEQIKILEEDLIFQRKMLDAERVKYDNKLVTYDQVLNFEYTVKQAEIGIVQTKMNYKTQEYTMAALLGLTTAKLPDNTRFEPLDDLIDKVKHEFSLLGIEYYLDLAIDQRPDLKQQRASLQQRKYQLYSAWGAFAPTVSANIGYDVTVDDWSSYGGESLTYGVSASWDLFNSGFTRYFNVRSAQIDVARSEQNVLKKWIDIVKEVRIAYNDHNMNIIQERISSEAVEISERQRDIVTEKFKNHLVAVTRINEVQKDLVSTQLSYLNAIVAVYKSKKNLDTACGLVLY